MNYPKALEWLYGTQLFGMKLGLDGPRRLLKEFRAFPAYETKVIHVAGTNGKGSTCAMIDSIARSCGWRCGLFTSPHLVDYRERMRVNGRTIPEDVCARHLTSLRRLCEAAPNHPTFFEITLAVALRWFRECGCELIVLETGMGGRLDATTAVPADVCVVTSIGMDHMQWLGDSLAAIAKEKAGIFVAGKPAISAPQDPAAREVLEQEANATRTPLEFVEEPLAGYGIALAGPHQRWNAALAVTAAHKAGLPLTTDCLRHALAQVSWPGRFERIVPGVVLDGAHNPHAARVLLETWRGEYPGRKAMMVFSAVAAKDVAGMLACLSPLAARIFLCPVNSPRALPVAELAGLLPADAPPHESFPSFEEAFIAARQYDETILVTGSLYLVGEARAFLTNETYQPSAQ